MQIVRPCSGGLLSDSNKKDVKKRRANKIKNVSAIPEPVFDIFVTLFRCFCPNMS